VIEWFSINWHWYGVAAAALALEYAYALLLTRSPAPDARARGYSLMFDSLEGFLHGVLLLAAVAALEGVVLAGVRILPPAAAEVRWGWAAERLASYLLSIAMLERDLTITVILSPLAGTVAASSVLARYASQFLLYFCAAMLFLTQVLMSYGSLMVSVGIALTGIRRVRSLGPYLVFSVLGLAALSGGLAPYVSQSLEQLRYSYQGGLDLLGEVGGVIWGTTLRNLLDDGRLLAQVATLTAVASGVVAAASAAASRAAGGIAETIASRIRGL
jgi:hypothetical protein